MITQGNAQRGRYHTEKLEAPNWMRLNSDPFLPCAGAFPTGSGKPEFVSDRMAQCGLDPVPGYTSSPERSQRGAALAREFPLALITPADHYLLNIFNNAKQRRRSGAATLLIRPDDPAPRFITTGDEVRVGKVHSFALGDVSDRGPPRVVASSKGRWLGSSKEGKTIHATVDARHSDMGADALYHDNRVRVDKVDGSSAHLPWRFW